MNTSQEARRMLPGWNKDSRFLFFLIQPWRVNNEAKLVMNRWSSVFGGSVAQRQESDLWSSATFQHPRRVGVNQIAPRCNAEQGSTLMSYQGRPIFLETRAARCGHTLNWAPPRSHTRATFPRQARRQRWRTEQGHWYKFFPCLLQPCFAEIWRDRNNCLTELSADWHIGIVFQPTTESALLWMSRLSWFSLQLLLPHLFSFLTIEKIILNDLENKTSGWWSSSGNDQQHPEFPHERGLKKEAAVVKQTWLVSPHCSLTFTAEGQKSYTTTRWALWCTSSLPFHALHLSFVIKIGGEKNTNWVWEASWLQWEFHYLSGLIDDRRSRRVIWMEITVESHHLEDKQSNNGASVLLHSVRNSTTAKLIPGACPPVPWVGLLTGCCEWSLRRPKMNLFKQQKKLVFIFSLLFCSAFQLWLHHF